LVTEESNRAAFTSVKIAISSSTSWYTIFSQTHANLSLTATRITPP
jgi:hypothetical protein